MPDPVELDPLRPTLAEVIVSSVGLLHVILAAVVVVQLVRRKRTLSFFEFAGVLVLLLLVPVVGPLLILAREDLLGRHRARSQHTTA